MTQHKNILNRKASRHSCAKLKTYHFSGDEDNKEYVDEKFKPIRKEINEKTVDKIQKIRQTANFVRENLKKYARN